MGNLFWRGFYKWGGVGCDNSGNAFLNSSTGDYAYIATTGAYQSTLGGNFDAYMAKFDSAGSLLWATYYGGSGDDETGGFAFDAMGNIFITGITNSTDSIATPGAYQTTFSLSSTTYRAVFLAKFNTSGFLQWATYSGGSGTQDAYACACDKTGNVYITGLTSSTDSIATPGSHQSTIGGRSDVFIAKFSNSGALLWATYYGGSGAEEGDAIICDALQNVFITGFTISKDSIATAGAYQTALASIAGAMRF